MKMFKFGLHLWIALTSVLSFVAGWILLAHAPKPGQGTPASTFLVTPLPTLEPLPSLNFVPSNNTSTLQLPPIVIQVPRASAPMPIFRTGAS
jgi:hypothetical protein